jgi:hypothetical protein
MSEWRFYKKLLAQGNTYFIKVVIVYGLVGFMSVLLRDYTWKRSRKTHSSRHLASTILNLVAVILLLGAKCLPKQPWRPMTSTLLFDTLSMANLKTIRIPSHEPEESLGLSYDPENDPYYVTNLNEPIDPFVTSALEGTKFNNIVHIILESMRSDSFPWQVEGILDQHIKEYMDPPETPVNSHTITPFITSLSENIISWDTMWSTIPYTLKAMLGRTSQPAINLI